MPVSGRTDSRGSTDYYVVFRNSDDTWKDPINMGDTVNTSSGLEYSPYVSPDGKYFFFMSVRDNTGIFQPGERVTLRRFLKFHNRPGTGNPCTYWVSAQFIEELRGKNK